VLRRIKLSLLFLLLTLSIDQVYGQKFAVIGDYGCDCGNESNVANLVNGWNVDFIVTVGDNSYGTAPIDDNIGQYYADWIGNYIGSYGNGSSINKFFPAIGNHDYTDGGGLSAYLNYFTLPNNELYYDFVWGNVHFFIIDSDPTQPDGILETSAQALWIKNKMINSTVMWKIAIFHRPPYSSRGSYPDLRWPFKTWGANAVIAGHKHNYERLIVDGLVYYVDGLGGKSRQGFDDPLPESIIRYNAKYGAMLVEATSSNILFSFYNTSNSLIDSYEITDPTPVELAYFTAALNDYEIELRWRTETEINNYGFYIERAEANSDWLVLGFVEGHGNTNSPKHYSFVDSDIYESADYYYRLKQIDNDGTFEYSDVVNVTVGVPVLFTLSQNYPNPFNPHTRIDYTLPEQQNVSLRVYSILGELVQELVNEVKPAGTYSVTFDASELPSGVYVYRLQTENFSANRKMTVLK